MKKCWMLLSVAALAVAMLAGCGKDPFAADKKRGIKFDADKPTLVKYNHQLPDAEYTIPDGVTEIGKGAFGGCANLTKVTIPPSVTKIGDHAFSDCWKLQKITIPSSVTEIGEGTFDEHQKVEVQPGNSRYFTDAHGVLIDRKEKTLLHVPMDLSGEYTIPDDVKIIAPRAFARRTKLTRITIPNGVTRIGEGAFSNCNLTSITIPVSTTEIGEDAFWRCPKVEVQPGNPRYLTDARGVLIDRKEKILLHAPHALAGSYTVPDGVVEIGKNAFAGCFNLTYVTIPPTVTTIGDMAFFAIISLEHVTIPPSVTKIAENAFTGCACEEQIKQDYSHLFRKGNAAAAPTVPKESAASKEKAFPLHAAAEKGDAAAMKSLLEKGADVNVKDDKGNTPLHVAAAKNNVEAALLLLDKGAKQRKNKAGDNPLHVSAIHGSADVANLLLARGAKPNVQNTNGETPLHLAAKHNRLVVAALLLKQGAKIDVKTERGNSPLEYALRHHNFKIAKFLLDCGAGVSYEYYVNLAIGKRDYDLLRFLTSISWNGISEATDTRTCLKAVFFNDTEAVKILLPAVALRRDNASHIGIHAGDLMLIEAAGNGNIDICRVILEAFSETKKYFLCEKKYRAGFCHDIKEYNMNFHSKWYQSNNKRPVTPLIAACETKHFDCAKLLIEHGADVNMSCDHDKDLNYAKRTALYYAVKSGDANFVKYLLSKGAKVDRKLLKLTRNEDIIELLDGEE